MSSILKNKHLEVEIGYPEELYKGSRFDHLGNIFQVTLNNKHTFCSTEKSQLQNEYGFGFLNEFDIIEPFSYRTAKNGDYFHKIGVGELIRENREAYHFFQKYTRKSLDPKISILGESQIEFQACSSNLRGMQYHYTKTISIKDATMLVEYQLRNIGAKSFETTEYCHNFLSINHHPIDSSYQLILENEIQPELFAENVNIEKLLRIKRNSITWDGIPESDFFIAGVNGNKQIRTWSLENSLEKAGISETIDFNCSQLNLWGTGHVLSPELFFNIKLSPGKESQWARQYAFYSL